MRFVYAFALVTGIALMSCQTEIPRAHNRAPDQDVEVQISEDNEDDHDEQFSIQQDNEFSNGSGNPTDSAEGMQEQMNFFSNFACFLSVQRHLMKHESDFRLIGTNLNAQTILKKIVAKLFTICKTSMTPEQQMEMITAKTREDIEKIKFEEFDAVSIQDFTNDPEPKITEDESIVIAAYEKIEEEVSKMKEKFNKEPEEKVKKSERSDTYEEGGEGELSIMGFDLNNLNSFAFVLPIIILLMAPLYYFWTKLYVKEVSVAGKNKQKRKLKKATDRKTV